MPRQNPRKSVRRYSQRKSTPKVVDGRVSRKNRHAPTRKAPLIRREQPGTGYRHFVRKNDVLKFIDILPDWETLSEGLYEIILAKGEDNMAGWHIPGHVAICAWDRELVCCEDVECVDEHAELYKRLGIQFAKDEDEEGPCYLVEYNESTVRAYQLMHIFLHELGHHHDRMTTSTQNEADRGESYAEQYALKYEAIVFERYVEVFGL